MKLSIITIAKNNLEGLKRTTESVLAQSWTAFEWIVIDGASTDGTVEYLQSLERQPDEWISEPDQGVYDAMNKGIMRAKGEYLLFLNSGDSLYASDTLSQCFLNFPAADIVYGDAVFIYPSQKKKMIYPEQLNLYYFRKKSLCHQATFIRASLLHDCGGYSTNYRIVSDWRQWLVWLIEGKSFAHLSVTVCNYMMNGLSTILCATSGEEREMVFSKLLPPVFYDFMITVENVYEIKRRRNTRYCILLGVLSLFLMFFNLILLWIL